jgi:hypothetical protein
MSVSQKMLNTCFAFYFEALLEFPKGFHKNAADSSPTGVFGRLARICAHVGCFGTGHEIAS